jgi:hypothetical protein
MASVSSINPIAESEITVSSIIGSVANNNMPQRVSCIRKFPPRDYLVYALAILPQLSACGPTNFADE